MRNDTPTGNPEELAGAYALNALSPDERALHEQYLDQSEHARDEAEELSETAVALGLATIPVPPSAGLKATLMDLIKTTPQLAPITASNRSRVTPTHAAAALTLVPESTPDPQSTAAPVDTTVSVAPTVPVPEPAAASVGTSLGSNTGARARLRGSATPSGSGAGARAQARWFQRPGRLLIAASAAIALFVGGSLLGSALTDNEFVEQQAASLAQINAAPDSQRASTTTGDGQEATLVWSDTLGIAALLVADLPALPADQDYQLWYINAQGPLPAGTFDSSGDGTVWRVLEGTMHDGDGVGVTVEPNGGSAAPTSDPIVAFQS